MFGLNALLVIASILFVVVCAFLILLVLIQPGRSGGLASMSSQSIDAPTAFTETLGIGQSDKLLYRWTMGCAIAFFALTFALTFLGNARDRATGQITLPDATPAPAAVIPPAATPASGTVSVPATSEPAKPEAPKGS